MIYLAAAVLFYVMTRKPYDPNPTLAAAGFTVPNSPMGPTDTAGASTPDQWAPPTWFGGGPGPTGPALGPVPPQQ